MSPQRAPAVPLSTLDLDKVANGDVWPARETMVLGLVDELSTSCIVSIIGPNGTGKNTLFRMITDQEKPDSAEIVIGEWPLVAHKATVTISKRLSQLGRDEKVADLFRKVALEPTAADEARWLGRIVDRATVSVDRIIPQ